MRGLRLRDEAVHPLSYFLTPCWSSGALNLGSMVESLGSFQKLWLPGPTLRFGLNWLEVLPGCPQLILVKSEKCCTDSNVSLTRVIIWQQGPWVLAWALATSTWSRGNLLSSAVSLWQSYAPNEPFSGSTQLAEDWIQAAVTSSNYLLSTCCLGHCFWLWYEVYTGMKNKQDRSGLASVLSFTQSEISIIADNFKNMPWN